MKLFSFPDSVLHFLPGSVPALALPSHAQSAARQCRGKEEREFSLRSMQASTHWQCSRGYVARAGMHICNIYESWKP